MLYHRATGTSLNETVLQMEQLLKSGLIVQLYCNIWKTYISSKVVRGHFFIEKFCWCQSCSSHTGTVLRAAGGWPGWLQDQQMRGRCLQKCSHQRPWASETHTTQCPSEPHPNAGSTPGIQAAASGYGPFQPTVCPYLSRDRYKQRQDTEIKT